MDWSRYAVGGAAARSDSFTGLKPDFASGVYRMVQDAHAAGIPLQITSAYRSPEVQARLYENALKKYGSPQAARKWVAPPGRSQHNFGTAVDFAVNGSLIRDANSAEARWIKENAAKYGLDVPMSWEPWQVEMAGARGQKQAPMTGSGSSDTLVGGLSIGPATVPDRLEAAPMQAEAPGGLLGRFFPEMSASRADEIRLGINGLLHNPNQGQQRAIMARMGQRQLDQREAKASQQQAQQANKTAAWLAQQPGGQEFAAAIASGALPANTALQMWRQQGQGPAPTDDMREYQMAVSQGYQGSLEDWILGQRQAGATTINTGDQGQRMGTVPPGYTAVPDASNPSGFRLEVIPGGPADREQQTAADQNARSSQAAAENEVNQAAVVTDTVTKLREKVQNQGIIPDTGVIGAKTVGFNQQAADIAGMLDTLKGMVVFDRLEQLKAASATGASGLGQVTEREISLLGAQLGALENNLSKDLILDTLDTVESVFSKLSPAAQAYLMGQGSDQFLAQGVSGAPASPALSDDELLQKYGGQ